MSDKPFEKENLSLFEVLALCQSTLFHHPFFYFSPTREDPAGTKNAIFRFRPCILWQSPAKQITEEHLQSSFWFSDARPARIIDAQRGFKFDIIVEKRAFRWPWQPLYRQGIQIRECLPPA